MQQSSEIKDLFDQLENRTDKSECRYQISVPITEEEKNLYDNNRTEIEIVLQEFLSELKTPYIVIEDLKSLSWKHGIKLHSLKRRLIEMGVIASMTSDPNGRNLTCIDKRKLARGRIIKVT